MPAPASSSSSGPRATSPATTTASCTAQCTHFVWLNRGKESVVADLTKPEDRRLFEAIVAKADVLVQNLKPGALAKLGFPIEDPAQAPSPPHLLLDLGLRRRRPLSATARPTTC